MTTDLILFLAVCAASALVAWASTRDRSAAPLLVTMPSWTLLQRQQHQRPWSPLSYNDGHNNFSKRESGPMPTYVRAEIQRRYGGAEAHW